MNFTSELIIKRSIFSSKNKSSKNEDLTKKESFFLKLVKTVSTESPFLYTTVLFTLFIALVCIAGVVVDERELLGVNVWVKPLKFAISSAIYVFTVGYLITKYPYSKRKKKILNNIVAFSMIIDVLIITIQGARGVQSHYNMSSAIDALLYASMGIFVGINVIIMLLFIIDTMRLKLETSKSIQWAILMGWLVVFFGSWVGGQMISQLSHNVAVIDGGSGLPLVNWSTKGGDLRIAHFFGLHGIQIIPLFAFWISNKWKTAQKKQIIIVTLFGLLYAVWIGFTFYQAKQGMPLISEVI